MLLPQKKHGAVLMLRLNGSTNFVLMKECILCKSTRIEVKERLKFETLRTIYLDALNIDIKNELEICDDLNFYHCQNCELDFFNPQLAGKASFYEELQRKRKVYYNPDRKEFDFASQFISQSDAVLEIGSGSGFFADKIKTKNYVGLEFNDEAIKQAQLRNVELLKQSIEDYAIEYPQHYDVVCTFHVLEHVQNPNEFIKASLHTLKAKGKLIIAVPCNDSVLTSNTNHVLNLPPHHISRWKIDSMKNLSLLFDLKLLQFEVLSRSTRINRKQYAKAVFLKKVIRLFHKKNQVVLDADKLKAIKRWSDWITSKSQYHKFFSENEIIGENMVFVFEKK